MNIQLNGQPCKIEEDFTLENLLERHPPKGRYAVAVNLKFIPKSEYPALCLAESDQVEVLSPQVGG